MATPKVKLLFSSEIEDNHYEVLAYPRSEMEGSSEVELADELAALTHSVEWRRQGRRGVAPGDRMAVGRKLYEYTDGIAGTPLVVWPHLGIQEV